MVFKEDKNKLLDKRYCIKSVPLKNAGAGGDNNQYV